MRSLPRRRPGRRPFDTLRTGVTREKKLLEKQKKGKARMREYGNVSILQEAFIVALRMGEE